MTDAFPTPPPAAEPFDRGTAPSTAEDREPTWPQRLLWAGQALHRDLPLYNMVLTFDIAGSLDEDRFVAAFQSVVDRSDALRSVFVGAAADPRVRVLDSVEAAVELVDLTGAHDPVAEAQSWSEARARRRLDPTRPLFDCALLRLGPDRTVWYLNQHHLITDAWSTGLVYRHVAEAYAGSATDESAPPLPMYADYDDFLRRTRDARARQRAEEHWRSIQDRGPTYVPLYGKGPAAPGDRSTRTERRTIELGARRSAGLRELARSRAARGLTDHASRFNVFAALLLGFVARVSGRSDVALGAPAHNRATAAFKETLGVFIELFPLSVAADPDAPFTALLEAVRVEAASFLRYAQPGSSTAGLNRDVNVVLNYINASFSDFAGLPMRSRWVHPGHGDAGHDLRVQVHDFDDADTFVLHLDISEDRFTVEERAFLERHFVSFIDAVLADPETPLGDLVLIDRTEAAQLRKYATAGVAVDPGPAPASVVEAFRTVAGNHPKRTALVSGDRTWSYGELAERVTGLAARLDALEVRGRTVALALPRSADAVVGMLGILEAGAAYLPLDPDAPPDRTRHMLESADAVAGIVTGGGSLPVELPTLEVEQSATSKPSRGPFKTPSPTDLAYVLFTSGSTGTPKGVLVEHGSLARYAHWAAGEYLGSGCATFALFTPLTFDLTVTSVFAPLVSGGTIVVYEDSGEAVDSAVLDVFADDAVDVVKLTPSHLALVADRPEPTRRIRTLVVGGEDLRADVAVAALRGLGDGGRVINEYGPTEATVACTRHVFDPAVDHDRSVPIGRPVAGAHIAVVGGRGGLSPTGVAGEIVIGGGGVARGYVGDPAATVDRFVPSPIVEGGRAYRSGDLGRWRTDGTLEYLGRLDRQVKVHGVRIEPAEIEAAIATHPGVEECVVMAVGEPAHATVPVESGPTETCARCGIPGDHPDVTLGTDGLCSLCRAFDGYQERATRYFGTMPELSEVLTTRAARVEGDFDCLVLLSGGKDSSYALYRVTEMGLRVLAVTLDNGFISEGAKENVRRVTEDLGVPHEFVGTDAMNEIFADSLARFSNVCQGCFKTMYTLAFNLALDRGIPTIVTGLSRGQFFETRLTGELFLGPEATRADLESMVLDARKAYHRSSDLVNRRLPTVAFHDDAAFERVAFVDFYRYCDVDLDEMLAFLDERAPWIRPADTGRSTNCLINDVGIYVHKLERGFHNYALPYSWDVRLGHKERDAALAELDDDIDEERVLRILDEIGYRPNPGRGAPGGPDRRLTAFVRGAGDVPIDELRGFLKTRLPSFMIPTRFVPVDEVPLTPRGKVDGAALERLARSTSSVTTASDGPRPTTASEVTVHRLWAEALGLQSIPVDANFFDLGGDSITAIRIAARAAGSGLGVTPNDLFRHQTIRELALAADASAEAGTAGSGLDSAHPGPGTPLDEKTLDRVAALLRRADASSAPTDEEA